MVLFSLFISCNDSPNTENKLIVRKEDKLFEPLLGFKNLDGMSMQVNEKSAIHDVTTQWMEASKESSKPWVMYIDE